MSSCKWTSNNKTTNQVNITNELAVSTKSNSSIKMAWMTKATMSTLKSNNNSNGLPCSSSRPYRTRWVSMKKRMMARTMKIRTKMMVRKWKMASLNSRSKEPITNQRLSMSCMPTWKWTKVKTRKMTEKKMMTKSTADTSKWASPAKLSSSSWMKTAWMTTTIRWTVKVKKKMRTSKNSSRCSSTCFNSNRKEALLLAAKTSLETTATPKMSTNNMMKLITKSSNLWHNGDNNVLKQQVKRRMKWTTMVKSSREKAKRTCMSLMRSNTSNF